MITTRIVKGDINACYMLFIDSLLADVRQSTSKKVSLKDLQPGFQYDKVMANKLGNSGHALATVVNLEKPRIYEMSFLSKQGETILKYLLNPVDEENFDITYSEEFLGTGFFNKINYKLMNVFYKKKNIKKAHMVLDHLEKLLN